MEKPSVAIIAGLSGSGKSTVLKALEDVNFYCVDKFPAPLLTHMVEYVDAKRLEQKLNSDSAEGEAQIGYERFDNVGILVDGRDANELNQIKTIVDQMRKTGFKVSLLFLDAADEVLIRRFKETRRPHPLLSISNNADTIRDALALERDMLSNFRAIADRVIDTSGFTPHELRRVIQEQFAADSRALRLDVSIMSFGFKYGVPINADIVFDVRFLANPHFVPELREKTGIEKEVQDYVFGSGEAEEFMKHLREMLSFLLPRYVTEGKRYLTVALGCTGGKHRSVSIAERLIDEYRNEQHEQFNFDVIHRDRERVV